MNELSATIEKAKELHKKGDIKDAHAAYQQILNNNPDNSDVLHHMGILLFQTQNMEQAVSCFKKSVQIDPLNAQAYFFLGMAFFKTDQLDLAMEAFNTALQKNPELKDVRQWQAKIFEKTGHIRKAYELFYDLFKKNKAPQEHFSKWIFDLSIAACFQCAINSDDGKKDEYFEDAIKLFEVLQQLNDIRFKAFGHYHAGLFFKYKGQLEKAVVHFSEAVKLVPGFKTPAFYYELLSRHLSQKTLAKKKPRGQLIFHIGYPKAGSTWLQNTIFPNLNGTHHLGLTFYKILDVNDTSLVHYGYPGAVSSLDFQLRKPDYDKDAFLNHLKKHLRFDGAVNTISDEALLQVHPKELTTRLTYIADQLDVDIKIIIVIRKQSHIVRSEYGQGIEAKKWAGKRLRDLIDWGDFTDQSQKLSLDNYDYLKHINIFEEKIGKENVLVLPFENLFCGASLEKIVAFMDVNHTREHLEFLTRTPAVNKTTSAMKEELSRLNPDMGTILSKIDDHFSPLNEALDEKMGLGLKELGYY